MPRNPLPVMQISARLVARVRHDTLPGQAGRGGARRSTARRAVVAFAILTTVGLQVVAGVPDLARAAESADGMIHISIVPGASEARYIMQVRTLGQPPRPATCSTRDLGGELVLTPEGGVVSELSRLTVDQRSLRCEPPLRDEMAQQLMQTAQHPTSTFLAQSAPGLPVPLTPGPQNYQLIGDQIVRGVARSVTYETAGTSTPDAFTGSARALLKMSDFGINPPKIGPIVSVDDEMVAEIDIKAAIRAPQMPAAEAAP
jgi:hypothetical protein